MALAVPVPVQAPQHRKREIVEQADRQTEEQREKQINTGRERREIEGKKDCLPPFLPLSACPSVSHFLCACFLARKKNN
jgi:hypothetical protein